MKKILIIAPYPPDNYRPRLKFFIEALSQRYEIDLLMPEENIALEKTNKNIKTIKYKKQSKLEKIFSTIKLLLQLTPVTYGYYYNKDINKKLSQINLKNYNLIFTKRLPLEYLNTKETPILFDLVDCFSFQTSLFHKKAPGIKKIVYFIDSILLPRYEKKLISKSSLSIITTELEKDRIKLLTNIDTFLTNKVVALPHGIATNTNSDSDSDNNVNNLLILGFHGKLTYFQNTLALKNINNIAREVVSKCEFRIIGKHPEKYPRLYPNLKFIGYAENLRSAYSEVNLAIFPIRDCVGIQNKVIEACSLGIPILITPEIFQSLPKEDISSALQNGIFVAPLEKQALFLDSYKPTVTQSKEYAKELKKYFAKNFDKKIIQNNLYELIESFFKSTRSRN